MNIKKKFWPSVRGILKTIHLWLALPSALVITIVCLSGTIYLFNSEIVELLNRDKYFIGSTKTGKIVEPEIVIEKIEAETGGKVYSLLFPASEKRKWMANVRIENERGRGTNYAIDPYSGTFESTANLKGQEFFGTVLRIHRWLLLERKFGSPIVGWATIVMSLLIISGLFIWVPRNLKYWQKGLKMKLSFKNKKAFNFNFHKVLGFYAAIFLLIMSLTGPHWSFQWYRKGIYDVLGVEMQQRRQPAPPAKESQAGGSGNNQQTQANSSNGRSENRESVSSENRKREEREGRNSENRQRQNLEEREGRNRRETGSDKPSIQSLALNQYLQAAHTVLPYKGNTRLMLPSANSQSVSLIKNKVGFFAPSGADRVELEMATAKVLEVNRFADRPFNQQITGSIKALHTGEIFGMFTKILYFLAALIASFLPATGVIIWINRIKGKQKTPKPSIETGTKIY